MNFIENLIAKFTGQQFLSEEQRKELQTIESNAFMDKARELAKAKGEKMAKEKIQ